MTLKALAESAGVSERFLVQLEGGVGNISVARLEDVAEALGTTGAHLLGAASGVSTTEDKTPVVALVGVRGAGKSTIGRAVAKKVKVPFVELDELIVKEAQMTLSTIFEIHGERYFRAVEREVLGRILDEGNPCIVATGGSIVNDPETWSLLKSRAFTVWLKATPEEHWNRVVAQGDVRPMKDRPKAMNELRQMLSTRTPLYKQADLVLDTSKKKPQAIVDVIAESVRH